jgi:AraC-like DNA-binding protein
MIFGRESPIPTVADRTVPAELSALLAAFQEIVALEDPDAVLRRTVELARQRIGLTRVGIFLLDSARGLMLGTWGTDINGALVDEHQIMYALMDTDREAIRRAREEGAPFTVFDDCPLLEHLDGETFVRGRSWLAATPIRSARATIGLMFNDAGLSGEAVDVGKQAQAAILCTLMGAVLDPDRRGLPLAAVAAGREASSRRLVSEAAAMLVETPGLSAREIADRLEVSDGRLARAFREDTGMSFVEYRNRLRLDRFNALLGEKRRTLLDAALAAGFGSYAQFHRVFRSLRRATPREYLRRQA